MTTGLCILHENSSNSLSSTSQIIFLFQYVVDISFYTWRVRKPWFQPCLVVWLYWRRARRKIWNVLQHGVVTLSQVDLLEHLNSFMLPLVQRSIHCNALYIANNDVVIIFRSHCSRHDSDAFFPSRLSLPTFQSKVVLFLSTLIQHLQVTISKYGVLESVDW